jgi:uncharacterized membrane protein YedE/YeeE
MSKMLPVVSFFIGILFSLGLGLSGMTDPKRVQDFLDVTGAWDPSLLFVMGAAIPVYFVFWQFYKKRGLPLFDAKSHVPGRKSIDRKLILGSAIFGVGWGLAGVCPGPGIAALGASSFGALVFVVGFLLGARLESSVDHKF